MRDLEEIEALEGRDRMKAKKTRAEVSYCKVRRWCRRLREGRAVISQPGPKKVRVPYYHALRCELRLEV